MPSLVILMEKQGNPWILLASITISVKVLTCSMAAKFGWLVATMWLQFGCIWRQGVRLANAGFIGCWRTSREIPLDSKG